MANCYFVDYENVHNTGLNNLNDLQPDDKLYIFYTKETDNISIDNAHLIEEAQWYHRYIRVPAGDQSLDKHLISFVSYIISQDTVEQKKYNYVIISKDKGYDNIITFLKQERNDLCMVRTENISDKITINTNSHPKTPPRATNVTAQKTTVQKPINNAQQAKLTAQKQQTAQPKNLSQLASEITKVLLDANYSHILVDQIITLVQKKCLEPLALHSIHFNLKSITPEFGNIYKLIKPTVEQYLKLQPELTEIINNTTVIPAQNVTSLQPTTAQLQQHQILCTQLTKQLTSLHCSSSLRTQINKIVVACITKKQPLQPIYRHLQLVTDAYLEIYRTIKPTITTYLTTLKK